MALPRCPECGREDLGVYDVAPEVRAVVLDQEHYPPHVFEQEIYRSYSCPCGWGGVYQERLLWNRPDTLRLRGKFCQPADRAPSTRAS